MACYVVADILITDRARYAEYETGFMAILVAFEGEILAVDEQAFALEGATKGQRQVILRFESETKATAWYHSDDYQTLMQYRLAGSDSNVILVHGLG
jgi:uncharacterized protein (DUF1330 family)